MIPNRADTLKILRLMGNHEPILMLAGDQDGYGTRWTLGGQQIEPAIARYLMEHGFIAEIHVTELGARVLALTALGLQFRQEGLHWWSQLNLVQRISATLFG
jgi:hypothetical protein